MAYQKVQCRTCGQWYWQGDAHTCPPVAQQAWQPLPPPSPAAQCPKCGSVRVLADRPMNPWLTWSIAVVLLSFAAVCAIAAFVFVVVIPILVLLVLVPIPMFLLGGLAVLGLLKKKRQCLDCGLKW